MSDTRLFDPGLQTERTLLAWRRTCLSLALASGVGIRLLTPEFGRWIIALGLAGVFAAGTAYILAAHRYGRVHAALTETAALPSGGRSLALVFGLVLFLDAVGIAYVFSHASEAW